VRSGTFDTRHRLYLLARVVIARHYRQQLTLVGVAEALSSSPRQLQRAYAQFGETTFEEDLRARRMSVAAELLIEQRAIPVRDVAHLVGYRQAPHFANAFRRCYGLSPADFREQAPRRERKRNNGSTQSYREDKAPTLAPGEGGASGATVSAPGRRTRISVPPPAARSAATVPPC
jgi:AraC family transcriptional regulator, regulatory protein of adaptative response / methylphosphotriester-DNA alkyltransferase methyltransferase